MRGVEVRRVGGGHVWPVENPEDTAAVIQTVLAHTPPFDAAARGKALDPDGATPQVATG